MESNISKLKDALNGKTVLIVEDEPVIRLLLKREFSKEGCRIIEATNAKVALKLFADKDINIVISDVNMPEGDGLLLLESIGNKCKETGVVLVMISGFSRLSEQDVVKYGAAGLFQKPFSLRNICNFIKDCLKQISH